VFRLALRQTEGLIGSIIHLLGLTLAIPDHRAKAAKLRHLAAVEDVDYRTPRGLDRAMFLKLASCDWIRERRHCLLTGPAGVGKSWLACALGYKACRENLSVFYQRVPRLFAALALARGDGRYARLLKQLARVDLLILDDWGPEPLLAEQQRDLLEIVEDRYSAGSLIITSQVPIDRWYEIVGNPTLADAILDRFIHNAHRIELKGESLRDPIEHLPELFLNAACAAGSLSGCCGHGVCHDRSSVCSSLARPLSE
jgi:DNA replication protein DnaC